METKGKVTIHHRRGVVQKIRRVVRRVKPTGHVAETWGGTPMYQWVGEIKFYFNTVRVWGYSYHPEAMPTEWANDTY